jgi:DNA-binding transcriptional regulator YdaS (Cro superfamily)
MNRALKGRIVAIFGSELQFARTLGVSPSVISLVVRGWKVLSADQQKRWARALGKRIEDLFPSD